MSGDLQPLAADKVVIEGSYDQQGECYAISVRMNQDVVMREDIVTTIMTLFAPSGPPVPRPVIRPAVPVGPPNGSGNWRNAPGLNLPRRPPPGESATEIIPVYRQGDDGQRKP